MTPRSHGDDTLNAEDVAWLPVETGADPGTVRRRATALAEQVGLGPSRTGEVAIVATELSTNLVKHAREGVVVLRILRRRDNVGVGLIALDSGPGVRDVAALMVDGSSTVGTLGIGLGAVRRLATSYDIHSVPGHGTVVSACLWHAATDCGVFAGLTRALAGETQCGDAYAVRAVDDGWLLLAVDGLGHGPLAASAAATATRLFRDSSAVSALDVVRELDGGMSSTRGGAAAVAHLDVRRGLLAYCAVGNIAGRIVSRTRSRGMVTHPGIMGHNARSAKEAVYEVAAGDWVVLHSDGLTEKWNTDDYPGLLDRSPIVVAATLMREAGVRRDDASVLVTRVAD